MSSGHTENAPLSPLALREKIDAVAMQAMLSEPGEATASLLASLSQISLEASSMRDLGAIPDAVTKLEREMQQAGQAGTLDPRGALESVLSCISLLQRLMEEAGSAQAAEPESSEKITATSEASSPANTGSPNTAISADPELLGEFFVEARDHLVSIEAQLLNIERDPSAKDAIHSVFRSFHTIKGLAGFLELPAIREVAHEVETLLDLARNEQLAISPAVIDVILEGADYLKTDIARVEQELHGTAPSDPADPHDLLEQIRGHMSGSASPQPGASASQIPVSEAALSGTSSAQPVTGQDPVKAAAPVVADTSTASGDAKNSGVNMSVNMGTNVGASTATNTGTASNVESRVVKVDIGKLDFLMDIVGELVIAQSMVTHDRSVEASANAKLQRNLAQLTRITGEVQKTAMAMRMVPVGQLFKRSVRLVRDLARKSGKLAELVLTGEDTEVDRNIVEELADPLMHMIRNAADHAIELPQDRVKAGKDATGRIHLKAYHQAGSIMIEVGDDGRGLDREKILKKARERGLISDGSQLSDKEVFNLIFEPGFSTAEKVTDISGRGVGMDVVRKQIQRMRGRVDIESRLGQGTTFQLKLPLTLAIIDGLVVGVGNERYIAPIYAVREMFRPAPENVFTVEGQAEMVMVRGQLLPVVRLHQRFGVAPATEDIAQSLLLVVETETRRFCLVVDELIDTQEVVIKNLGETFRHVGGIAGGTILGDGRVGLILDIDSLFTGTVNA